MTYCGEMHQDRSQQQYDMRVTHAFLKGSTAGPTSAAFCHTLRVVHAYVDTTCGGRGDESESSRIGKTSSTIEYPRREETHTDKC
jgi:hypothetical protein